MNCRQCNTKNRKNARICKKCGNNLFAQMLTEISMVYADQYLATVMELIESGRVLCSKCGKENSYRLNKCTSCASSLEREKAVFKIDSIWLAASSLRYMFGSGYNKLNSKMELLGLAEAVMHRRKFRDGEQDEKKREEDSKECHRTHDRLIMMGDLYSSLHCEKCGMRNEDDAKKCSSCGKKFHPRDGYEPGSIAYKYFFSNLTGYDAAAEISEGLIQAFAAYSDKAAKD